MKIFLHISKSIIVYLLIGLLPVIFVIALFNTLIPVYILNIICPIISILIFYNYYFKDLTSKEHGILSLLNFKNLSLKDIVKILILAISLIYSITFIAFISSKYFPNSYSSLESMLSSMPSTIIYILCTCIIGPIYEEILFRGLIFNKLKEHIKPVTAIIIQALIFGLFHGNLYQLMYTFIIDLVFASIYLFTDSIVACMLLHILYNSLSNIIIFPTNMTSIFFASILGFIGVIIILRSIYKEKTLAQRG